MLKHRWHSGVDLDDTWVFPALTDHYIRPTCHGGSPPWPGLPESPSSGYTTFAIRRPLSVWPGEPLLAVSRRLGHSSIAITADVYSQVLPEAAKQAASTLSTTITGT